MRIFEGLECDRLEETKNYIDLPLQHMQLADTGTLLISYFAYTRFFILLQNHFVRKI